MKSWADRIGRRLKLRDFHVLMQVVQWGSMAKAAQELGISTPVVSKTIADVEHTLGVPLLDRHRRGIEPTIYGRALVQRGVVIFDELRQSVNDIESLSHPTAGEVRIGSTEPLAGGILSAVIERLNRQHPGISFHVSQGDFATLQREMRAREIDLMIGRTLESISEEDMDAEVLFNDRLSFIAGRSHRLAARRKIELADLVNEQWSLPPDGSVPRVLIDDAFRAAHATPPQAVVSTFAIQVHISLLATGRFLAVFPASMLHFSVKHLSIKALPVDIPMQLSPVVIVKLKNRTHSPVAQLFIDCAHEVAKPLAGRK